MKEAMGGIFSIQTVLIFIVLVCGLLLFSVSYTRSFRVKNELRRVIEKYEGLTEDSEDEINRVMKKYNYSFNNYGRYEQICERAGYNAYVEDNGVFCYKCNLISESESDKYKGAYYTIATFVNVDIPLINKIFEYAASYLRIEGETALIYSSGNNSEICSNARK